jgi:gliding motility-associated-like protein
LGGGIGGDATGATWSDGGVNGTFNPNVTTLNATWTPPALYSGTATLTLTAIGLTCNGSTASLKINVTILPTASISYSGNPFCKSLNNPQPATLTGTGAFNGGTWSAVPAGLSLNSNTGAINPGSSTAGLYTVTYTIPAGGGCPAIPVTTSVTITTLPIATFNYAGSPYCSNEANPLPTFIGGGTAGTFSSTAGLVFISTSTGQVDLVGSTAGTYTVTNTIAAAGGCGIVTSSAQITISDLPVATFSYGATPYCSNGVNPSPTFIGGGTAGTFSSTPGLVFISTSTGQVNLAASTHGTYTVTNTFAASGGCGIVTATAQITITTLMVATFSYALNPYCSNEANPSPTFSGGGVAGTFSSTAGLVLNTSTGQVNLIASTAGTYTVTNTIPAAGGCGQVTATSPITITDPPSATITYSGSPWCGSAGLQSVTLVGTTGGTFAATPAGLSINATTGEINPATSSANTYTVTYTLSASGGCGTSISNVLVTISPTPTAPVAGVPTQPTCSVAAGSVVLSGLPAGNWTVTRNPGNVTTAGTGATLTVTLLATGTYTFTVTNSAGCVSSPSANVVINAQPASPAAPVQSVDCTQGFGKAVVTVTSPIGADLEYSLDGGAPQASPVFNLVNNGPHSLSVTNAAGCTKVGLPFTVTCGCINPPSVTLSSNTGNTCGTTAVTVTENTFGGTATNVTLSSNGDGVLNPLNSAVSPFSFTYTPVAADGGKNVIITVTTNNPLGTPCLAGVATYTLTVNATPSAPAAGTITNPTCSVATGSVVLNGLPPTGTWTLTRNPGGIITNGTGTSTTVSGLVPGTYNFTVTSAQGCLSPSSANVVIVPPPSSPTPPVVGAITQPTCALSTGSVVLSGLPSPGNWTLTRNPGGVTVSGSGVTTTVTTLPSGTYTFSVTNTIGCISSPSGNVVINVQPSIPPAPNVGTITPPGCTLATGSVLLSGLPATGAWTLIRYPGTVRTTGSGTSSTLSGLPTGTYNYTVTTAEGCLSVASANVVIPVQPATPAAPVVGTITQPTLAVPSGSVELSGLPAPGAWTITLLPDSLTTPGSGTTATITNLAGGAFTFTVTNSSGCTSAESTQVVISTPGIPVLTITDPAPVCSPATVDITSPSITEGSTPGLTLTYWTDSQATIQYNTPAIATAGTYYIKGTTVSGYFNIKPVVVTIDALPVPNGGPDQTLDYQHSTTLDATLGPDQTGIWSLISGSGTFSNSADPGSTISDLSLGANLLLWSVKTAVCPEVSDTVKILVDNILIPTLITPNMDGRNDYFVVKGLTALGKTELYIFDRRGVQVYKNLDYDNSWDGIDYNKNPLPDDTYFYVIKPENGKPLSGYIVIRR